MSEHDIWSNLSITSKEDVIKMAAFLEERALYPDTEELNQRLCELVAPKPGENILEVGSGSGVICRMLTSCLQPDGVVIGMDISSEMAITAHKYAMTAGYTRGIDFGAASAASLPFPETSFDCALAARLLLHAAYPGQVIREMKRLVKPGGRVVVMDWDFDSVTVDHPDKQTTRKILHWRNDNHGGNNWSGRQLWRQMNEAGLVNISVHPWVSVAHDDSYGLTQSLWRAAEVACMGSVISETERRDWVNELKNRIQLGTFFASIVYFIVMGNVASPVNQAA
jgi:ubiquinone/menaquinone biosynthesis C-methylase UbiE